MTTVFSSPILKLNRKPLGLAMIALLSIAGLSLSSCLKFSKSKESYGLRKIEIELSPENLGRLNGSVEAKKPIDGAVSIDGKEYKVRINYAGKSTIDFYKKSYDLELKDGSFEGKTYLRISSQAVDKSFLRTLIGYHAYNTFGVTASDVEPISVYVNDEFKGLFILVENVDERFFNRRGEKMKSLYKAKYANADFGKRNLIDYSDAFSVKGTTEQSSDLAALLKLIHKENSDKNQKDLSALLDIEKFLRYLTVSTYLNHWDGLSNNFFLARNVGSAPFEIIPWDLDRIYENAPAGERNYVAGETPYQGNHLITKVLSYPEYRARYIELIKSLFTKALPTDAFLKELDKNADKIREAYLADRVLVARGPDFDAEVSTLKEAINNWHKAVKNDVISQ